MIRAITIINHLDESIRLELERPQLSGFIVKEIKGLGPAKAQVNFTEMATMDGGLDNSARLETRDIDLSLIFMEHPTIEDTRHLSYKYFPIKRKITFIVETDTRICQTTGIVEENVPEIFSKQEGCSISILCADPYFYSVNDNEDISHGVKPLFEFIYENNSLTQPLTEFGEIVKNREFDIFYEGDLEIGFVLNIHAIGKASGIRIINRKTGQILRINDDRIVDIMETGIDAGDDIILNTNRGEKGLSILRGGVTTNIINALERPVRWFQLSKGHNPYVFQADKGLTNLIFTVTYRIIYEGV